MLAAYPSSGDTHLDGAAIKRDQQQVAGMRVRVKDASRQNHVAKGLDERNARSVAHRLGQVAQVANGNTVQVVHC